MITVVEQVKCRFYYGFLNSAVPSLYFFLVKVKDCEKNK